MIVVNVEQGSPDWFQARCGIMTASNFEKIITTKGEPSKSRLKYLYQLAGEKITGKMVEGYQNEAMQRGKEMEAEARNLYELLHDVKIQQVCVCYRDEQKICAASPDGLVGEEGLVEIKCPLIHTHVSYLDEGTLPVDYFQQVQGQLYVTGRKWLDFVSYFPGLKPLIVRVERDQKFLLALEVQLGNAYQELNQIIERVK